MTATTSTQQEWFRNFVSATVSILGVHAPDADGDLAVSGGTCMPWVRTGTSEPWGVRVFALAARDVPLKAAVYEEIDTDTLRAVIRRVLEVADHLGPMITAVHGGTTPIVPEPFDAEG